MEKTLVLTFKLIPEMETSPKRFSTLETAKRHLERRLLTCVTNDGNKIIAKHVCKDWNETKVRGSSCPENSYWNIPLEGLTFVNIRAEYTNAFLPAIETDIDGDFEWLNGESYWPSGSKYQQVVVTCLPSRKEVWVSMNIKFSAEYEVMNIQRKAFLETEHIIEGKLKITQTAYRLVQSFESDPSNRGRTRRFKNELFLSIARIF